MKAILVATAKDSDSSYYMHARINRRDRGVHIFGVKNRGYMPDGGAFHPDTAHCIREARC